MVNLLLFLYYFNIIVVVGDKKMNKLKNLVNVVIMSVMSIKSTIATYIRNFARDVRAELTVSTVIMLAIGIYVVAAIIPGAITQITGANKSGWGTGEVALWGLLPLIIVVAIILLVLPKFKK